MVARERRDQLDAHTRAEDIILGSLGFGEEAKLCTVQITQRGYAGTLRWRDGSSETFECDDEITELHRWALELLAGAPISIDSPTRDEDAKRSA